MLYFWKAWNSRISNMTFLCVKYITFTRTFTKTFTYWRSVQSFYWTPFSMRKADGQRPILDVGNFNLHKFIIEHCNWRFWATFFAPETLTTTLSHLGGGVGRVIYQFFWRRPVWWFDINQVLQSYCQERLFSQFIFH